MANRGRFKNNLITHDFVFDAGLGLTVRAKLVVEIIKYLMYQRQQLPLALDQLKKNINTDTAKGQQQTEVKARLDKRTNRRELHNAIKAVGNLDQIFDEISQAFEICSEIRSVLILFGTTPVSPKESYLLTMPVLHPEHDSVSVRNSIKSIFRQIITQDVLGDVKNISPTNMTVMVNAPKNSGITWFLPKPHFKVPVRGRRHVFNLNCDIPHPVNHSIDCGNETAAEISGIEPLESSANDISMVNFATRLSLSGDEESLQDSTRSLLEPFDFSQSASATSLTASGSSVLTSNDVTVVQEKNQSNSSIDVACNNSNNVETIVKDIPSVFTAQTLTNITEDVLSAHVWFQAPVFVKGYKDKSSKSSIFM